MEHKFRIKSINIGDIVEFTELSHSKIRELTDYKQHVVIGIKQYPNSSGYIISITDSLTEGFDPEYFKLVKKGNPEIVKVLYGKV